MQVIVPVYNSEAYIEDCIESVLSQRSKYRFLLTVVNDGSKDRTEDILRKYEGISNVEIINQENRGLSGARNAALKHIKAHYITFLDSDDMMAPDSIDIMLDKINGSGVDIVEGSYQTFIDKGRVKHTELHEEYVGNAWLGYLFGYPWGKVFRSEMFLHLQFPEGYWFEDTLCSFLIYPMAKKVATIPDIVYNYRLNPNGITSKSGGHPKVVDTLLITKQLLQDALQINLHFDLQLYDMFLIQVRNNARRIFSLRNEQIDKLTFSITSKLKKEYFPEFTTKNKDLKDIEQSLDTSDFYNYLLAVI